MKSPAKAEAFTVYITKYALTQGIIKAKAEETTAEHMIKVRGAGSSLDAYYHLPDYARTPEEAVIKANAMRVNKVASLKKSLAKMEALTFSVDSIKD